MTVKCEFWLGQQSAVEDILSTQVHLFKAYGDLGFWLSKEHLNETRRAPGFQAEKRRTLLFYIAVTQLCSDLR